MRSFWFDPYLWVHLAGIAAVPLLLECCLLGLAIGEPLFPVWFELLFVGAIGILPILWMQWQRPFSIFSLMLLALKPSQLTEDQRRILQRFKLPVHRVLAVLSALAMAWVLWQLYQIAPAVAPGLFPGFSRGAALLVAAIAFLGSNLFLQVPVSVLSVLLASDSAFAATPAYPRERITQDFTISGIRVAKILPPLVRPVAPIAAQEPSETPTVAPPAAKPVPTASVPFPPGSPAEATTVEPPAVAADDEPDQELEFDDRDTPDVEGEAEIEAEIEAIIAEEVEIVETIARDETAAIEPIETQTRDAVSAKDLEHEVVEAIAPSSSPVTDPGQTASLNTQSLQLDESREVIEEIIISPEQPVAIEPDFPNPELANPEVTNPDLASSESNDFESMVSRQVETNSDINPASAHATVDAIDPQSPRAVERVETNEIIEDSTIVETFDETPLARETSEADHLQTNQPHMEAGLAELNEENSNEENPNKQNTNGTEPQQGVE